MLDKVNELQPPTAAELDKFLAHFGTRGMRWGVRKAKENKTKRRELDSEMNKLRTEQFKKPIASAKEQAKFAIKNPLRALNMNTESAKKLNANVEASSKPKAKKSGKESEDSKTARENLKKPAKELSNAELATLTKRLQLEKQYNDLHPSDYQKGMKVVNSLLAAGTTVNNLHAFTQSAAGQPLVKQLGITRLIKP